THVRSARQRVYIVYIISHSNTLRGGTVLSAIEEQRARALRWRKRALIASVGLGALAAPMAAQAQNASTTGAEEVSQVDEVVVTGSRLQRSGLDAPTPTMALTAETIEAKGITNI